MGIKQKSTRLKEFYASLVATVPVMVTGMQAGFPAFIMLQLQKELDITTNQVSWLVFAGYFSLLFGPLLVAHLINKYGRKTNLRFVLCLFIAGWSIILISTSFATLLIGTILCGVASGGSLPLTSTYISEISRAQYRPSLLTLVWLMGIFGTAFVYLLEFSLTWRGVVLVIVGISAFGLTQLQVIPESKFWYLMQKRKDEALEATAWFENTKVALKETEIIYTLLKFGTNFVEVDELDTGTFSLKSLKNLQFKPLLLSLSVIILRCGTGKILFTVYPIQMFSNLGTPYNGKILGITYGLLNFVTIIANMLMFSSVNRFNRKNFFYICTVIMVTSLTSVIYLESSTDDKIKPLPGFLVFFTYIYLIVESTGFHCVSNIMVYEVVPLTQRNVSNTIHFIVTNVIMAIYAKVFPLVQQDIPFRTLCVYFLFNVLLILLIVHYYYPNTRGNMFAGYEKQFFKSFLNSDIEKLVTNDFLRNEQLQDLVTGNDHINLDILNSQRVDEISKECADSLRNLLGGTEAIKKFVNEKDLEYRTIDENTATSSSAPGTSDGTPMQPLVPEEILDTVKEGFNTFMEKNPVINKNQFWNANKKLVFQQQEWIKNVMLKADVNKLANSKPMKLNSFLKIGSQRDHQV